MNRFILIWMRLNGSMAFTLQLHSDLPQHLPVGHAFFGAGIGNFVRCKLTKHHFTLFLGITASVAAACLIYAALLKTTELLFGISLAHEAGYICSMLFIIPGFPFITSGIDLAKLDMRSGLERLAYAMIIILVATLTAWIMALILHLKPSDFPPLSLTL